LGGRIARVAHELNTPVSLIVGSVESLEQQVETLVRYFRETGDRYRTDFSGEDERRYARLAYAAENAPRLIAVCDEGTRRLRHVLDQLKAYVAYPVAPLEREPLDLAAEIERAVSGCSHARSPVPRFEIDLGDLPPVLSDRDGLGQVLSNLIENAIGAVTGRDHGRISIAAHRADAGRRIEVLVRDNGPGIPAQNREAIFEPFFTTNSRGAGLGLGLAIAREIAESMGGSLRLGDPSGEGAELILTLPAAQKIQPQMNTDKH
jgi:two-component system sensor histidine kinase HupT/HoxJ